jgi:transcriptional regulator with XRE-family HTH domain
MRRSDFDVQVGNRLRMARFRAKLTPAELAKMVGSDEAEIESCETGSSVIYLNELVVLCKALNVSPNILLGWHDAK